MVYETPEINPNPNIPVTMATAKNINAQTKQLVTPFLFIFLLIYNKNTFLIKLTIKFNTNLRFSPNCIANEPRPNRESDPDLQRDRLAS